MSLNINLPLFSIFTQ